jgi:cyclase
MGGISLGSYVIAIDSGCSYEIGTTLRRELEAFFALPVKHLFLTHTHTDHRKGMDAFTDTALIASRKCIENMPKNETLGKWSVKLFDVELALDDVDLSAEFHLVSGHSVGSSVVYVPDERVVFGGDLFISGSVNFGLPVMHFYQNRPRRTGNPDEYIVAYEKIREWKVETIVPGHGDIINNAHDYLDDQISFFEEVRSYFISSIDEGKSLEDIDLSIFEPIRQAYVDAGARARKSHSVRWLDRYLELLKKSFYNHYSCALSQSSLVL